VQIASWIRGRPGVASVGIETRDGKEICVIRYNCQLNPDDGKEIADRLTGYTVTFEVDDGK
jgi:hypothetical protein